MAIPLMTWGLFSLWIDGKGTPAPIAPTHCLVTTGAYRFCRTPIELGTCLYFLALATWLDSLSTGLLCMGMGIMLGSGYITIIDERELKLRFKVNYEEYIAPTPLFFHNIFSFKAKRNV